MFRVPISISVLALTLLLLSGCGGGSSGSGGGGGDGGGTPTTVTVTIGGATPTAVATQIGTGQFAATTLSSGKLTLSLPSGTTNFAIAYVCPPWLEGQGVEAYTYQKVYQATTFDGSSFAWFCPLATTAAQTGSLTVSVDATAVPDVTWLYVDAYSGQDFSSLFGGATVDSSLAAPIGTDQVYVLAYNQTDTFLSIPLLAAKLFTSQNVPGSLNGGSTVVLGPEDETTEEPITYSNAPAGFNPPLSTLSYFPSAGQFGFAIGYNQAAQYPALPAAAAQSGGTYVLLASAAEYSLSDYTAVNVDMAFSNGGSQTVSFPKSWSLSTPTPAALPMLDTNYNGFAGSASVSQSGEIIWNPSTTAESDYSVTATQNYQNGTNSIAFPDLSGLPGFLASPPSGATLYWTASVSQGNIGNNISGYLPNSAAEEVSNGGAFSVP